MQLYENTVKQVVLSVYTTFTPAEKQVADFFLNNQNEKDLSAKIVSKKLYVSMASLTRFAKKCGYAGYREFLYEYSIRNHEIVNYDQLLRSVLNHYQQIISSGYQVLDEYVLQSVAQKILSKQRIFVYGIGSSGFAASEMKYRFMRLGIDISVISDTQMMKMNNVNFSEDTLLICISLSGNTYIRSNLLVAKEKGSDCVLITAKKGTVPIKEIDYEIIVPSIGNIEIGNIMSPVFPTLLAIDILYAYCLLESPDRYKILGQTLSKNYERYIE